MQIDVDGKVLWLREWCDMDAAVAGVGVKPTFVFGRDADPAREAVSLSGGHGAAVVVVGEPGAATNLPVGSAAGRVWLWQGRCVVSVRPEPWSVSWRELDTPVVTMRGLDAFGVMAVVCEDGVVLLSPELETLRSWPTDLVTTVEWQPGGVRVGQWDADPVDVSFANADADAWGRSGA